MADIDELTDEERETWAMMWHGSKLLHALEQQAQRIKRALEVLSEPLLAGSTEARLAADVRRILEG